VKAKNKIQTGDKFDKGRTWREKCNPIVVGGHDYFVPAKQLIPHGILDIVRNEGSLAIGTGHDTSPFAVASLGKLRNSEGNANCQPAEYSGVTADAEGSNGYRSRGMKFELQKFSDEIQLPIKACHYPRGTSKCNPVEHCLFSFISMH
jgi:hypothetical protein